MSTTTNAAAAMPQRIPTIVPRDLVPRPEVTMLRIVVTTAIPMLMLLAFLLKRGGVPRSAVFVTQLMIATQVTMAIATAQKEMLAASASYFHVGLGRRVARAQAFWGLALPAVTTSSLASVFGLSMLLHAAMTWLTLRAWWAFQLPAFAFYFFFIPVAIRKAKANDDVEFMAGLPALWLVLGAVALVLLVRHVASRGLRRRLHDTIALGPEAVFRPGQVQAYKQRSGHGAGRVRGARWRNDILAGLVRRAAEAGGRGDAAAAVRWQLVAASFAANFSPRPWVAPFFAVAILAMIAVFGYMRISGSLGEQWYVGLAYQAALAPVFNLSMVLLGTPLFGRSRRTGLRAETQALVALILYSLAGAAALKLVSELMVLFMPVLQKAGGPRAFIGMPLHGLLAVAAAAPLAWLAMALFPRSSSPFGNIAAILGFYTCHAVMTQWASPWAPVVCIGLGVSAFAAAWAIRRRWWLGADMPA
jgi:hypothetical protein